MVKLRRPFDSSAVAPWISLAKLLVVAVGVILVVRKMEDCGTSSSLLRATLHTKSELLTDSSSSPLYTNHRALNQPLDALPRMPQNHAEAMELILKAREQHAQRATFLQIGANNGEMFDPLYPSFKGTEQKKKWIGLQAEPQPTLFGKLVVLHSDAPDWSFYPGAVASPEYCIGGKIKFCETKTPGVGDWSTQGQVNQITDTCLQMYQTMHYRERPCVSSLDQLIYQHASPEYLNHVLDSTGGQRNYVIDFLQIDVEGKDYDVLSLVDWTQLHPICVSFEMIHLTDKDYQKAKTIMADNGYTMKEISMDILACRVNQ